jgi:hypothetical protein
MDIVWQGLLGTVIGCTIGLLILAPIYYFLIWRR